MGSRRTATSVPSGTRAAGSTSPTPSTGERSADVPPDGIRRVSAASEFAALDATAQAELVRRGDATAVELVEAAIARDRAAEPDSERGRHADVRARARRGPGRTRADRSRGVPYLVKDLVVEVAGVRFTEGSVFLRDNVSTFDSELVVRLRRAGLIILGKTNTPEFGMVPTCEPSCSARPATRGTPNRSTSGSSGGSAAAVASGDGAGGARQRSRRLDPVSGLGVRAVRAQADAGPQPARPGVRRRGERLGGRARADAVRARQRRAARRDVRAPRSAIPTSLAGPDRPFVARGRRRSGPAAHRVHRPHTRRQRRPLRTASPRCGTRLRCASRSATRSSRSSSRA